MPLPLSTAKATKNMPGHYGHSKKAGAKKASAKKKPAAKKAASKKVPPAFLKNMKKKGSAKK